MLSHADCIRKFEQLIYETSTRCVGNCFWFACKGRENKHGNGTHSIAFNNATGSTQHAVFHLSYNLFAYETSDQFPVTCTFLLSTSCRNSWGDQMERQVISPFYYSIFFLAPLSSLSVARACLKLIHVPYTPLASLCRMIGSWSPFDVSTWECGYIVLICTAHVDNIFALDSNRFWLIVSPLLCICAWRVYEKHSMLLAPMHLHPTNSYLW